MSPKRRLKKPIRKPQPRGLFERVPRWWLYAVAAVAVAALLLGNAGFRTMISNTFVLRGLEAEIVDLKEEEGRLKTRIDAARGDDRALERAARKELGYQKPGEVEYRFPPPGSSDAH